MRCRAGTCPSSVNHSSAAGRWDWVNVVRQGGRACSAGLLLAITATQAARWSVEHDADAAGSRKVRADERRRRAALQW